MIPTTKQGFRAARLRRSRTSWGFTLIELLVSMAVFLVVGGAALTLFRQHTNLFGDQQRQVGLNISLRNALSQIQIDSVEAGNGFFTGLSTANTPVGITIVNNAGPIDVLNIVQTGTTPAQLDAASGCINTSATTTVTLAATAGVTASQFNTNDEVLFMNGAGNQMTTAVLTAAGATVGGKIQLQHVLTNADGTNNNDPLKLTATAFDPADGDQLGVQFCPTNGDWVVKLSSVQYTVDAANELTRTASGGATDVVADQIIGFKVGASTFQAAGGGTSTPAYSFNATNKTTDNPPGYNSKFNSIRSIRVSLIGRTPPNQFSGTGYKNSFDGGSYRIESLSVIINPRNISMND
jgi:prepilin-type N-terminal cleavage/methylation domain-containing protein